MLVSFFSLVLLVLLAEWPASAIPYHGSNSLAFNVSSTDSALIIPNFKFKTGNNSLSIWVKGL